MPFPRTSAFFILQALLLSSGSFAGTLPTSATDSTHCLLDVLQLSMTRERNLEEYDLELAGRYAGANGEHLVSSELKALPPGSTWMNIGVGEGGAEENVLNSAAYKNIHSVVGVDAVHIEKTEALKALHPGRFEYLPGKTLQESIRKGPLKAWRGKVDYLTDLFSGMTYSRDLAGTLADELKLLKVGGKAHFNIHLTKANGTPYVSLVIQRKSDPAYHLMNDGEESLRNWLSRIKGAKVTIVGRTGFNDQSLSIIIEKTSSNPFLPELIPIGYDMSKVPPIRTYEDPNQ